MLRAFALAIRAVASRVGSSMRRGFELWVSLQNFLVSRVIFDDMSRCAPGRGYRARATLGVCGNIYSRCAHHSVLLALWVRLRVV